MNGFRAVDLPPEDQDGFVSRLVGRSVNAFVRLDWTWFLECTEGWCVATESSWRLLDSSGVAVTGFDHEQKFGLPAPLDVAQVVSARLSGRVVRAASIVRPAGDLILDFGEGLVLQCLVNSSGYDSWRLSGPGVDLHCLGGGRICASEPFDPLRRVAPIPSTPSGALLDRATRVPYQESLLDHPSREFAEILFQRVPGLREHAQVELPQGQELGTLRVAVSSPSGKPEVGILLWMEEGTPSLEFGEWHTHADCWMHEPGSEGNSEADALIRLLEDILADRILICVDVGGAAPAQPTILLASDPAALLEELTDPSGTGRVHLFSWSGRHDRDVGLEDFTDGGRGVR